MKKRIYLFAVLVVAFSTLQAQVRFGAEAGLVLANTNVKTSGFELDSKAIPTFQAGLVAEFGLSETVFIQSGVQLAGRGFKYEEELFGTKVELSANPLYLQVPALVAYDGGSFFIGAGPYLGFGIAGKYKSDGESEGIDFGSGGEDDYSATEFGAMVKAGLKLNQLRINLGYGLGLTDVTPADAQSDDSSSKQSGIILSLGYMF